MNVRLAPPHLPPCPLPLPRCGRGKGRGLVPLTFSPGPFTLSHGATKRGGWPPHLRPGPPPHFPPSPLPLLRCGRGRGRGLVPLTFPLWPLYALTRGEKGGRVASLPLSRPPSPSPLPPSSPTLRERKGERLVPLTFPPGLFTLSHGATKRGGWPPYLRPGPLTFPPAPFLSHAVGEEGGEGWSPSRNGRTG